MLKHQLRSSEGILIIEPIGPLEMADFTGLSREIDPYIAEHGKLLGLLLHAKDFLGWKNLEAATAHKKFFFSHQKQIQRIAVVSDSWLLTVLSKIVANFIHPEVKHFSESSCKEALQWLVKEMQ